MIKIVENVKHYRREFYRQLHAYLDSSGVDFQLYYSPAVGREALKADAILLPEAFTRAVPTRKAGPFLWQKLPWREVLAADVVMTTRANRLANNYVLMALRKLGRVRLGWWGHAYNYQARAHDTAAENLKRRLALNADWWFSYLPGSRPYLTRIGFPADSISIVENSIPVDEFKDVDAFASRRDAVLQKWGLATDPRYVIFSGSLYPDKRIDFLLDAVEAARRSVPQLELVIIGDGPLRADLETAAASRPWVQYKGMQVGAAKAELYAISEFVLNPGLVGLSIIDSFAAARPMITTDCGYHSPEIEYLQSGVNGVMTADDLDAYVDLVVDLLKDSEKLAELRCGARIAAETHTIERMVEGVGAGIMTWIERNR